MTKLEKVFRDPVHNFIEIEDPIIYGLINTTEFQRLRRIKQLGTTSFTFHGAEHNRFSHCLGVYGIAKRITDRFTQYFPDVWNPEENQLTQCAALLHDLGHGAYSHTFEHLFDTDHEAITREIITSPESEVNSILCQVSPDFPEKVASVINHSYPNQQVVQLISSQIDADRMDYLLRDAYFTGAIYGQFDLTRILKAMVPIENGIAFRFNGAHSVEDYIVSRYQMYMQVYFHPASRGMEAMLAQLLKRAKFLYYQRPDYFKLSSPCLIPFFEQNFTLKDYLRLDDGVLETYFQTWIESDDKILSDLAYSYTNRKIWKSFKFSDETSLGKMQDIIKSAGFDPAFYTAIHSNFDLPYDIYKPKSDKPRTNIVLINKDKTMTELSEISPLVTTLSGNIYGNNRFYFPKVMLDNPEFTQYIRNEELIHD
ncbi:MAG: HD domain-containing protein [Streptococcaceae bacterium]|jgi:HD superfamily phosphohydrolase|nr:HD domain-containing protein [Streptococcaceae bacterium]